MVINDLSQIFLFTFRSNGEAHGARLAEVLVEQLVDQDPSVAPDAYKRSWFGTEEALEAMLMELGFPALDVQGVMGALRSHRNADRKLAASPDQLYRVGFRELASA